jgi:hypothetical protein
MAMADTPTHNVADMAKHTGRYDQSAHKHSSHCEDMVCDTSVAVYDELKVEVCALRMTRGWI